MWRRWWWFQEKGPVIPGPELGWFYGTQCLLGSTEDITDDFDILKFNLWCFNPFERGYFLNNWPTNSIYGICKLFSQELLEVFLPNSLVEIKKKKKSMLNVSELYWCVLWALRLCTPPNFFTELCDLVEVQRQLGDRLWMELGGLCRCWYWNSCHWTLCLIAWGQHRKEGGALLWDYVCQQLSKPQSPWVVSVGNKRIWVAIRVLASYSTRPLERHWITQPHRFFLERFISCI